MSPNGQRSPRRCDVEMPYMQDNGLFVPFGMPQKPESQCGAVFGSLAKGEREGWPLPMFAVVPDVPYDGPASRERSRFYLPVMRRMFPRVPLAVAVQNGMGEDDVDGFDVIAIAGDSIWKEQTATFWVNVARERGMKVHALRVTTARRLRLMQDAGCDSADGNIWHGDKSQKKCLLMALNQLQLFEKGVA
jgi:hypothetical protein